MKFKATLVLEYSVNPEDYNTTDPSKIARMDEEFFTDCPEEFLERDSYTIEVEHIND